MDKISIIIPCFNEEEALPIYYAEMKKVMDSMKKHTSFELLFVDDGSSDRTYEIMKDLHRKDGRCQYLSFSRNFGKEAAIYAGLQNASGDYAAIMDVDLQDPPSLLPDMYRILKEEAYDSVATRRSTRMGEPKIRSFLSKEFYNVINKISKTEIVSGARDYRLMNRKMIDAVLEMSEYNRFSKGIFGWVGFRTKWLEYENIERSVGETKWNVKKLFIYSLEGITGFSDCSVYGSFVLRIIISDDCCDRSPYINLGRSGGRMAIDGLYLVWRGWCTASVYRNSGTVSCQDIPGSKEPACIPVKGFQ